MPKCNKKRHFHAKKRKFSGEGAQPPFQTPSPTTTRFISDTLLHSFYQTFCDVFL